MDIVGTSLGTIQTSSLWRGRSIQQRVVSTATPSRPGPVLCVPTLGHYEPGVLARDVGVVNGWLVDAMSVVGRTTARLVLLDLVLLPLEDVGRIANCASLSGIPNVARKLPGRPRGSLSHANGARTLEMCAPTLTGTLEGSDDSTSLVTCRVALTSSMARQFSPPSPEIETAEPGHEKAGY